MPRAKKVPDETILELRRQGLSMAKIGKAVGLSSPAVCFRLAYMGEGPNAERVIATKRRHSRLSNDRRARAWLDSAGRKAARARKAAVRAKWLTLAQEAAAE